MRPLFFLILLALGTPGLAADQPDGGLWLTGLVKAKNGMLVFVADKPVPGNAGRRTVLIGPTRANADFMGSILMVASERHAKLRFYGYLAPFKSSGSSPALPTMEFGVTKVHSPSDPDVLPPGSAVRFDPHTPLPGYRVKLIPAQPQASASPAQAASPSAEH